MNGPPDTLPCVSFVCSSVCCMLMWVGVIHLGVNVYGRVRTCVHGGRGGAQSSTREALLGVEAWGSPEGTARLEEPLAGQQLNKRWEGSVSLEGQERWEAPRLSAEDKQMLAETEKKKQERKEE